MNPTALPIIGANGQLVVRAKNVPGTNSVQNLSPPSMAAGSKICGVCGDAARCHHFGGLCCASCKAFFRRSVVKDQYKEYRCIYGGSCVIDVTTRKHCSHCRLKNCLAIGMDKKWFMSEEMRAELKRKSLMKMANNQRKQMENHEPFLGILPRYFRPEQDRTVYLNDSQLNEIESMVSLFSLAYKAQGLPEDTTGSSCRPSSARVALLFGAALKRIVLFIQSVPLMRTLSAATQLSLLRGRLMEVTIVSGCMTFDPAAKAFTHSGNTLLNSSNKVHVCARDFISLHNSEKLLNKHFELLCTLLSMGPDKEIIILLCLVVLFTQDRLEDCNIVKIQDHFIHLLKMYLRWKFGPFDCESFYDRFILKLSDVRQTSEMHQFTQLKLSAEETEIVEKKLGGLSLIQKVIPQA